jgi:hypothetical protein
VRFEFPITSLIVIVWKRRSSTPTGFIGVPIRSLPKTQVVQREDDARARSGRVPWIARGSHSGLLPAGLTDVEPNSHEPNNPDLLHRGRRTHRPADDCDSFEVGYYRILRLSHQRGIC